MVNISVLDFMKRLARGISKYFIYNYVDIKNKL